MERTHRERADATTRQIADRVARRRKAAGMSQTELGKRLAVLAPSWSRSAVVKLENYSRASVSVSDLFALALVLDVPPAVLIADPRETRPVQVADGMEREQWDVLRWVTGAGTVDPANSSGGFTDEAWLIQAGYHIEEAIDDLNRVARGVTPEQSRERTDENHRQALNLLATALTRIQAQGAPPPRIPDRVMKRAAELSVELPGVEG